MTELIAILDGVEVGRIHQNAGRLKFRYCERWQGLQGAYPISTAMPLLIQDHSHAKIERFLWGLLPDNEQALSRWGQHFQVSPRNPFALLSNVGEDCAGAIQFVAPEKLDQLMGETASENVEWLDESAISERLKLLKNDAGAGRIARDKGQFSLAGAQPKTAFLRDESRDRWGIPSGRTPTTHIFKPPTGEFDGFAENEHLCLAVAQQVGLAAASSEILTFGDQIAIVVKRYDRRRHDQTNKVSRVHQEDFCQALSVPPTKKYQNQGGPGPLNILHHLRSHMPAAVERESDVMRFCDALIFNWLIVGSDAHAKNYSILIGGEGRVRLAPLYDVISLLPYGDQNPLRAKLAMKIGDEYAVDKITSAEWAKFSASARVSRDKLFERIKELSRALPDAFAQQAARMRLQGLDHAILNAITDAVAERCARTFRST